MTIKIQEANILDKLLNFLGKRRAIFLHPDYNNQGYYIARRENFFYALLRPASKPLSKNWVYPDSIQPK
ncbi:MAG: hypothetical protein GY870_05025 [archaeon]|nr:hypothetical protein [archaeon]